jgi:FKBP-type peptidyl-prolyl cis-trans isomerase FkpA
MMILTLNNMIKKFLIVLLPVLLLASCSKDEEKQDRVDREKILEYIEKNNLDATETESGLFYLIDEPGNDEHPDLNSLILVHYKGYLLNGYVFESTEDLDEPLVYQLALMIKGWREGIPYFGKGGKGKLLIPSKLGYGGHGFPDVPAYSVLIFDIHLVDFE